MDDRFIHEITLYPLYVHYCFCMTSGSNDESASESRQILEERNQESEMLLTESGIRNVKTLPDR